MCELLSRDPPWRGLGKLQLILSGTLVLTLGVALAAYRYVSRGFRWPCEMPGWR